MNLILNYLKKKSADTVSHLKEQGTSNILMLFHFAVYKDYIGCLQILDNLNLTNF